MTMLDTNNNKRKYKRYNIDGIHGNMLYSADINVVNISMVGAAIETTKRLSIDKEYTLKIKYKDKILNIKGIVVWSTLSHTEHKKTGEAVPAYKAGIKFTNVLSEISSELVKFIENNKTKSLEKRMLGVRFKVTNINDAKLDFHCEYKLKRISLSGMLIETESSFDVDSLHEIEIFLDERVVSVAGRIVNCIEFAIENKYDIGIEFVKMSDEDNSFLKDFLKSLDVA